MRVAEADLLFVPGLGNSGPDHWQTRWQQRLSTGRRIEQDDWDKPDFSAWRERITAAIGACGKPVILIGHSLGVHAIAHAVSEAKQDKVRGAFLVAPPSAGAMLAIAAIDPAFAKIARGPLPFPSLLVASRNDVYADFSVSENLALDWGSQLVDAGEAGHINAESGHGPWPEGLMRFATFMARL